MMVFLSPLLYFCNLCNIVTPNSIKLNVIHGIIQNRYSHSHHKSDNFIDLLHNTVQPCVAISPFFLLLLSLSSPPPSIIPVIDMRSHFWRSAANFHSGGTGANMSNMNS